jgi:hypothetical protein
MLDIKEEKAESERMAKILKDRSVKRRKITKFQRKSF